MLCAPLVVLLLMVLQSGQKVNTRLSLRNSVYGGGKSFGMALETSLLRGVGQSRAPITSQQRWALDWIDIQSNQSFFTGFGLDLDMT